MVFENADPYDQGPIIFIDGLGQSSILTVELEATVLYLTHVGLQERYQARWLKVSEPYCWLCPSL